MVALLYDAGGSEVKPIPATNNDGLRLGGINKQPERFYLCMYVDVLEIIIDGSNSFCDLVNLKMSEKLQIVRIKIEKSRVGRVIVIV